MRGSTSGMPLDPKTFFMKNFGMGELSLRLDLLRLALEFSLLLVRLNLFSLYRVEGSLQSNYRFTFITDYFDKLYCNNISFTDPLNMRSLKLFLLIRDSLLNNKNLEG